MVSVTFSEQTYAQTDKTCVSVLTDFERSILSTMRLQIDIGIWQDRLPRLNTDYD